MKQITHSAHLTWTGNTGAGTKSYDSYSRDCEITFEGKPSFRGTADPGFMGNPALQNPKDFLISALSSTHMLYFLALCAKYSITVTSYEDTPTGYVQLNPDGSGLYEKLILRPKVSFLEADKLDRIKSLHDRAQKQSLITDSVKFPIHIEAEFITETNNAS